MSLPILTEEQFRIYKRVTNDPFYFSHYAYIIHPVRGKVIFDLYEYQKAVLWEFLTKRFNIILKFRQAGLTELIAMYCLWLALYHDNKNIQIISIKDRVAKRVLKRIKYMYKNLPDWLKTPVTNQRGGEVGTQTELEFVNGSIITSVPTTEEAGRSEAVSLLVIDEAAIVRWASQIWAAAFPTLSCCVGTTRLFKRVYNNGKPNTEIIKLRDICPREKGVMDISNLGYYTLTHTGSWKLITHSQNKGKLETWFVKDKYGNKAGYTPAHKLFTTRGWKTVEEIINENLNIISVETLYKNFKGAVIKVKVPNTEVLKPIPGFDGDRLPDLLTRGKILEMAEYGYNLSQIAKEVYPNKKQGRKFIKRILTERNSRIYISKLTLTKKTTRTIFDIQVEGDHSYISASNFVNHNTGGSAILNSTPMGVGNFYHKQWVDAKAGISDFNPIRLYWQMHPERDQKWYDTMKQSLGDRRTAQEIDGDFLTSGNTVFNLTDIRAIEDDLPHDSEYDDIRENGKLYIYRKPKLNERCYIGADVAIGRSNDFSAFSIMNNKGEELGYYKGKIAPGLYSKLLMATGKEFNRALIAPESNDIGLAVTTMLQTHGYPHLYYAKQLLKRKGKNKPQEQDVPGWYTTSVTRPIIIDELEEDVRMDSLVIRNKYFVDEAYTFIYDSRNRPIAMGKDKVNGDDMYEDEDAYTDDSIMAEAITNYVRKGKKFITTNPV